MNKDDILKDFDTLAEAKRKGAGNLKLCLGFALVVVVLVLAWGLVVNFTALDKAVSYTHLERMLVGNVKKAVSLIQNPANIKMMLIKQIGSFLNPFKEL